FGKPDASILRRTAILASSPELRFRLKRWGQTVWSRRLPRAAVSGGASPSNEDPRMSLRVWLYVLALASTTVLPLVARAQCPATGAAKCVNVNVTARTYAVADLVIPIPGLPADKQVPCARPTGPCVPLNVFMCDPESPATETTCADRLIRLITGTCSP